MAGSGGVIVMDDSTDMLGALANINAFYAHESCGQCTPCREGSLWMKKISSRMAHGTARVEDVDLIKNVADQIAGRTICAFGEACSWPTQSFVAKFGDEMKAQARAAEGRPGEAIAHKEQVLV
jgi:NADH-quinone oxidoreductase subunit F